MIPSGQTSPSEEGFANLQKPVIYPDIHLNIGCDKVRGDVHVMIVPTTDAAGGEWRVRRGLASFSFLIFHLFGRAQGAGTCASIRIKNMRKPESTQIRQRENRFGSGSVLLIGLSVLFLTWLRGDIEGFVLG